MRKPTQIAAIDIGSSKITTIISTLTDEENKLRVVGVASIPSKGIRKSQVVDIEDAIEAVTESVESAERMAGFSISGAYVSISGIHIDSQNSKGLVAVQNPEAEITENDVDRVVEGAKAVPLQTAREVLHVIPRHFIVDNQEGIKDPVGMSGVRLEAETHIITGSAINIKNLNKVVSEIGVNTTAMVYAGLASSEAVLTRTERELGVIMVDIGGGTTSLCIFVEDSIAHSAVIPVGAKNITNDIAIGLRVNLDTAEEIKRVLAPPKDNRSKALDPKNPASRKQEDEIDLYKLGIKGGPKKISRKAVLEGIARPRIVEIFELIKQEVKKSGYANQTPSGVVITGGGALTYNINDIAKKSLNMPARIARPTGLSGLIDEIKSPEYATATGLIKYALTNTVTEERRPIKLPSFNFTSKIQLTSLPKKILNFFKSFLP